MKKNDKLAKDILPENFNTIEEFSNFWDAHSSADYEDDMISVEAQIELSSSKAYCPCSEGKNNTVELNVVNLSKTKNVD